MIDLCSYLPPMLYGKELDEALTVLPPYAPNIVHADTADQLVACDYVGIVSGNREPDKFAKAGFTAVRSEVVDAPIIEQLPMTLECEVVSYDQESNYLVGRIVNVSADESILTDGKIDYRKLRPITYDPIGHHYVELGEVVGNAFAAGKALK